MQRFVLALLLATGASAFMAPVKTPQRSVMVAASSQNPGKQVSAAALAALLSFSSVAGPLLVMPDAAHAARSGGRAGGSRSFSSRPAPARAPAARAPAARVNTNTNYAGGGGSVRYVPSPVMGFGFSPFGYSPFGGMGTGYALGSMASSGQRYETNRLENEVSEQQKDLSTVDKELAVQKEKNAELEARLARLEAK